MCDYSLQSVKSRPAVVGDRLSTYDFGTGTRGFRGPDGSAVCVMPGTEIAFDRPIILSRGFLGSNPKESESKVAIFRQINKDTPKCHHDALELPDGQTVLLAALPERQFATVLQLPAAPRTPQELEDQKRIEYAG